MSGTVKGRVFLRAAVTPLHVSEEAERKPVLEADRRRDTCRASEV